jgi:hypothetical protein
LARPEAWNMKLLAPLGAILLLAAALPAVSSADDVAATLAVEYGYHLLPAPVTCSLAVHAGGNVADLLDAAVASGCVKSWSAVDYGTPGHPNRFVDCLDALADLCARDAVLDGTFWAFYVNGALASTGIDQTLLHAGDKVELAYGDYFAPFTLP